MAKKSAQGRTFKCKVCGKQFYLPPCTISKRAAVPCCSLDCKRRITSRVWDNVENVKALYSDGKSIWHIQRLFGGDHATIAKLLRANGIKVRPAGFYSDAARNGRYKGGSLSRDGYRVIQVNKRSVFEHRKVMSDFLKRELIPCEHVHHMNGDKLDNRIENLALLTPSVHGRISARQYSDWRKMYQARIAELEQLIGAYPP